MPRVAIFICTSECSLYLGFPLGLNMCRPTLVLNEILTRAFRDSIIVSVGNCVTSFFAGFVIFSSLGFLAGQLDVPVKDATESGVLSC